MSLARASKRVVVSGGYRRFSDGTVDQREVEKFRNISRGWWDPSSRAGTGLLHHLNPVRVAYIRRAMRGTARASVSASAIAGMRVLDVGCGGGILSESLARLGAEVTAIDPAEANIRVAREHSAADPLTSGIDYRACAVEELAAAAGERGSFDAVAALEVIEHVAPAARPLFLQSIAALLRPGGLLFMSTLNRTWKAYALAVFGAERVAGLLPAGTHEWAKFCTPEELDAALQRLSLDVEGLNGIVFEPSVHGLQWRLDADDVECNFILHARKQH